MMDNFNRDLDLLENLSKKISDLIYNNDFSQIPFIDAQRRALIKKLKKAKVKRTTLRKELGNLLKIILKILKPQKTNYKTCLKIIINSIKG